MDWEPRVGMRVVFLGGCTHGIRKRYFFGLFTRWVGTGTCLVVGNVYQISEVWWTRHRITGREQVGINILNDPEPSSNGAYAACLFRLLDERRLDIFRAVLTKAPTPEKEPA